jgi:hypothetical protein
VSVRTFGERVSRTERDEHGDPERGLRSLHERMAAQATDRTGNEHLTSI